MGSVWRLFIAAAVVPIRLAAGDVSGQWTLSLKADRTRIPVLACTLAQKGQEVTGSCRAEDDPKGPAVKITNGRVDGDRIEFGWTLDTPDGEAWTYTLTGTVDERAGTMKGSFNVAGRAGGGEGTFAANKRGG